MRIISKIHDYYDSAMALGVDVKRVFVRDTRECIQLEYGVNTRYWDRSSTINKGGYTVNFLVIGFCGEMYPCIRLTHHTTSTYPDTPMYIYDVHEFNSVVNEWNDLSIMDLADLDFIRKWLERSVIKSIWYEPHDNGQYIDGFKYIFLKHKTPYFVINFPYRSSPCCNLMPLLKDYKFYKIKDSYTAYQEIDMFLHNQLCDMDNPHIDPIPDVIKAQSKGFNKFSFRKDKSK